MVRKGIHQHIDSYSAFFENDRRTPVGMADQLRARGIGMNGSVAAAWKRMLAAGVRSEPSPGSETNR